MEDGLGQLLEEGDDQDGESVAGHLHAPPAPRQPVVFSPEPDSREDRPHPGVGSQAEADVLSVHHAHPVLEADITLYPSRAVDKLEDGNPRTEDGRNPRDLFDVGQNPSGDSDLLLLRDLERNLSQGSSSTGRRLGGFQVEVDVEVTAREAQSVDGGAERMN